MCGISGALTPAGSPKTETLIRDVVRDQLARGPDHQAIRSFSSPKGHCTLGHNRLSIIDLSSAGEQPMLDREGRFALVFNGEIYNYVEIRNELVKLGHAFVSKSDSEVILEAYKAWGTAAITRFNGMFAFAIFDQELGRLFLCRDRFGVKPLYFLTRGDEIAFASTTRVLARHYSLNPSPSYVARGLKYLIYEDSSSATQYEGLEALRPGQFLEAWVSDGKVRHEVAAYYDLRTAVGKKAAEFAGTGEAELAKLVRSTLEDAIRLRTRADVPIGVSLSGGLDSTSIAGLLAKSGLLPTAFSFSSVSEVGSEGRFVADAAAHNRIDVDYVWPPAKDLVELLPEVIEAQDAPFSSGSIVAQYCVFRRAHEAGFKVLMGGQGADEAFMGYRKFQLFALQDALSSRQIGSAFGLAFWMLPVVIAEAFQWRKYQFAYQRYFAKDSARPGGLALPEPKAMALSLSKAQSLVSRQILDVTDFSLPTLLRYEDRNSMGHSVESRLPFMDYRLVELVLALPRSMKVRRGYGKWVVRDVVADVVPGSIRKARFKMGFGAADETWIDAGLSELVCSFILRYQKPLAPFLGKISVQEYFSRAAMRARPGALHEAISLMWLGSRLR